MKIAFTTYYPKESLKSHHGFWYYMAKALADSGHNVVFIDDLGTPFQKLYALKTLYYKFIKQQNYFRLMDTPVAKSIARQVEAKLALHKDIDLIVAPGSIEIAYLNTDIPIILWSDTPFSGLQNFYDSFKNLPQFFIDGAFIFDELAHQKSKAVVYPSQWAVDLALESYNLPKEKLSVINFGASIDSEIAVDLVKHSIDKRLRSPLSLFFAGIEWERKGGEYIFETLRNIRKVLPEAKLHIAGISLEVPEDLAPNVVQHGFLSKRNPFDYKKLLRLFQDSHFFIMPSKAETYGVVFAEASSMGLPIITSNIGGISSVVQNEVNGFTFDLDEQVAVNMSDKIIELYQDKAMYAALCLSALDDYHQRINWRSAIAKFNELIDEVLNLDYQD